MKVFFDTSVLLAAFGPHRTTGNSPEIFRIPGISKVTFEKCLFECFLAFRGIGGKKPDEGRQDWATRYLKKQDDPSPIGEAAGKLHGGSIHAAHLWVGHSEEAFYSLPETFEEYFEDVQKYVKEEDWSQARPEWDSLQSVVRNHWRYQRLFAEFESFLTDQGIAVIPYETVFSPLTSGRRLMVMDALSKRSSIPSEDFEIAVAGLMSGADVFASCDSRFLRATASIELNIRSCRFVHFDEAAATVKAFQSDRAGHA